MDIKVQELIQLLGCDKRKFEQTKAIELIRDPFKSPWTTVYDKSGIVSDSLGIFSCFAEANLESEILSGNEWIKNSDSFSPGFCITPDGVHYEGIGSDGFNFIVAGQYFYPLNKEQFLLNQEFILLLGLYRGTDGNYYEIDESGNKEVVTKFSDVTLQIRTKSLMRYMSAKQLLFVQFIDSQVWSKEHYPVSTIPLSNKSFITSSFNYSLEYQTTDSKDFLSSRIIARSIVKPQSVDKCGIWPYDLNDEDYPEFIVKELPDGSYERYTCDNSKLSTYFGHNPDAPHYLTPIFFNSQVLDKYRKKSNFTVSEGRLTCGSQWSIEIDNFNPTRVMAYLGDLGRDLPGVERRHFLEYNVSPTDQKISRGVVDRDFFGIWTSDIEGPISRFCLAFSKLNTAWQERFGKKLYRDFHPDDSRLLEQIRIPTSKSQEEFESVVLSLQRLLIEYMDETQFAVNETKGSINKLESFLKTNDVNIDLSSLRNLQNLRSEGTAHAKGRKYDKLKEQMLSGNPIQDAINLVEELTVFMDNLALALSIDTSTYNRNDLV